MHSNECYDRTVSVKKRPVRSIDFYSDLEQQYSTLY